MAGHEDYLLCRTPKKQVFFLARHQETTKNIKITNLSNFHGFMTDKRIMYYVYTLFSLKDRKLYTGFTSNLKKRFSEHTSGNVASTCQRRPLQLIYYEAYLYKEDAVGRENFLKGGSGKKYLKKQLKHFFNDHPWKKPTTKIAT